MFGESFIDDGAILQITVDECRFWVDGGTMSLLQVIKNDYLITSPDQFRDDGAADISSAACDEYFHVFTFSAAVPSKLMFRIQFQAEIQISS